MSDAEKLSRPESTDTQPIPEKTSLEAALNAFYY